MTEYVVTANRLNFRSEPQAPSTANIIAILPWGHALSADAAPSDGWLKVTTSLPRSQVKATGFVSADYVAEEPKPPGAVKADVNVVAPSLVQLRKLAPLGNPVIMQAVVNGLPKEGANVGLLKSPLVLCHFLAQACEESDQFKTTHEYWGPTALQFHYEGRTDLGNVFPGDGKRFMGRGIFQLTGRSNYRTYGRKLGLNLEGSPELAADPDVSFRLACSFWDDHGLTQLAEADDIKAITKRINGGLHGLPDRQTYLARAKKLFM